MLNKKFLISFIVAACLFFGSVAAFGYSIWATNRQTDLGFDLSDYAVTKMYIDSNDNRIVGTQDGEIFAFDESGDLLWNVGKLNERAVYDVAECNGTVFAAYADGKVISFTESAAKRYYDENEDAEERAFFSDTKEYYAGLSFSASGNVKNTQIIVSQNGGGYFFLRGVFNERTRVNRIYRFNTADASCTSVTASSSVLGGMVLDESGTLWWAANSVIWNMPSGGAATLFKDVNESLQAISYNDGSLYAITESSNLLQIDSADPDNVNTYNLKTSFANGLVFSTGSHFVAKINNGGVALIDTEQKKVTVSMSASNDSNLIMWRDDGFALRDESDITNPTVIYYSRSLAASIALFGTLVWVFAAVMIVLLLASLYLGFSMSDEKRYAINNKIKLFFKALWKYKAIYLCLVIPMVMLVLFYYVPICFGFGLSFFDYIPGVKSVFVGFSNFAAVVQSAQFWKSALTMLAFLVADLLKALIPPILLAEGIMAVRFKRFSLWVRILLFLPGVLPGVATVLVWSTGIFGATSNSLVNGFISLFVPGFAKNWIYSLSNATAIGSIIMFGFPWIGSYLIFYGAISGINSSIFEAAKLDGCSWGKRILKLDIPLILPQIKYIFVTSFIASVQSYTNILVLHGTNGQIQTPALVMYSEIINANYGVASAIGVLIFIFLSVATFVNFKMQSDKS